MATYKKHSSKERKSTDVSQEKAKESATAEVFEKLDTTASKTEEWVAKYQNIILIAIVVIAVGVISYLGYNNFILEPKNAEAVSELNQAQYYFDLAVNSEDADSLYLLALNGGEGKYGFLDIIENYKGTTAAKLAAYSAGMAYLNLKNYENAIAYLNDFDSEDVLLSSLSKGAIGDAFAQMGQLEKAYNYYLKATEVNKNLFTTPKYLFKAAMLGPEIGKTKQALQLLKRIKNEFSDAEEAELVELQIGRLEASIR